MNKKTNNMNSQLISLAENAAEKVRHVPKRSIVGIMTSAKTFSLTLVGELSHQNV